MYQTARLYRQRTHGLHLTALLCLVAGISTLCAAARPARSGETGPLGYTITDLPGPGGGASNAVAVWTDEPNNVFLAAGSATAANSETHAFLWQNGAPTDLGTLGGDLSSATGVAKDAGGVTVVGLSRNGAGQIHAFIWRNGTMTALPTLGGSQSSALGIDLTGVIYGYSDLSPSGRHACYWSGNPLQVTDLSAGSQFISKAWGYGGGYAGYTSTANSVSHAALWQNNQLTDLGTLGGSQSVAYAANADFDPSPKVVGESQFDGTANYHAFLWQNGQMQDLGTLGGTQSTAYDIDASGQVVGKARLATNAQRAAIWEGASAVDLNTRLLTNPGWTLTEARAIDNRGYIVGNGALGGVSHGYLLRPIFELGPAPLLNTVSPATGRQGQSLTITLGGLHFIQGATVSFGPGVMVNSATVSGAGSDIGILHDHILTLSVAIAADAALGARDVTVTNPDGQSVTKTDAFTLLAANATPALLTFTLTPTTARGGTKLSGAVTLTLPAPSPKGAKVTFTSSNPSVKPPKAITVKKGLTTPPKAFVYATKKVKTPTTATITATYGGVSKSVIVMLTP
jgi:probable HAF family extracellular repeat protein